MAVSTSPSTIVSRSSGSIGVDVSGDSAVISIRYANETYFQGFKTPIGSLKLPIHNVANGTIYAKVTGSVEATPQVEGVASVSPTALNWNSSGSQSIAVSHEGSMFSFDTFAVELRFKYVLRVAIGIEAQGESLSEYAKDLGTLSGVPTVTIALNTFPVAPIIIAAAIVAVIGIVAIRKRKPSPKASVKPTRRDVEFV